MNIVIQDKYGNQLQLERTWKINNRSSETGNNIENNFYNHGGGVTGNNKIHSGDLEIAGIFKADTEKDANQKVNEIISFLIYGSPCRIWVNNYIDTKGLNYFYDKIYVKNCNISDIRFADVVEVRIGIILEDPFRNYFLVSKLAQTVANNDEILINNDTKWGIPAKLTLTANTAMDSFTFFNTNDTNRKVEISYGLIQNDVVVLDPGANMMRLNGDINLMYDSNGNYIYFVPGVNTLQYSGGGADILFEWYYRSLF